MRKRNTILIVFDELTCFKNLPKNITDNLPGYQLFKKKCLEFNNIQTSRQQCTPSRSVIMTGVYDTGLQDNIDNSYQYDYIPTLPTELNTTGLIYKSNGYEITGYYGKQHLDSKFADGRFDKPTFNTATTDAMKIYGYDKFNVFGDTFYPLMHALLTDNLILSYELPPNSLQFDYYEPETRSKYSGIIPFLKARLQDNKSYYIELHITNPHDTNHFIQNLKDVPSSTMNQYPIPFAQEQIAEDNVTNPYFFNDKHPYAVPSHPNILKNYFEPNYEAYKSNLCTLPFLESYQLDYAIDPKINSYNPLFIGTYYALKYNMTLADSQDDIKDWKNFVNNYYGLLFEADSYLEKLYWYFECNGIFDNNNIIIIADHGDQLSSHGLKQKQMPFKECSNVPCLIYSPDLDCSLYGKSTDIYGSLVDILPTQMVLNNLVSSSNFDGKSLLIWDNSKLKINYHEHKYYNPVNIVNSTMYSLNYFFYLKWYFKNYNGQQLTSNPSNYFDYESSFCSIITKINHKTYKYGRYYSIYNIIKYYNDIQPNKILFNKINLIKFIIDSDIIPKITLGEFFKKQFPNDFTFEEGLDIINKNFNKFSNNYILYAYYGFIANNLNNLTSSHYPIPGSQSDWETNSKNYSYFLYDLNTDPNEVANLLDPKNINYVDINLKMQLNNILNISLKEKNCNNLITILPWTLYIRLSDILYIFGGFLSNLSNDIDLNILGNLNGVNAIDSQTRPDFIELYTKYTNSKLSLLNSINFINPYNLYDEEKNLYYVGEYEYINYIHDNFSYFNKFILMQGKPDLTDQKFRILNFNIFPNLILYEIL